MRAVPTHDDRLLLRRRTTNDPRGHGAWRVYGLAALAVVALVSSSVPAWAQGLSRNAPAVVDIDQLARRVAEMNADHGQRLEREGRLHEAESYYRRAMDADAGYLPGHLGAARLLAARERRNEALALLAAVPARAVATEDDLVALARSRADLGDVTGALAVLGARRGSLHAMRVGVQIASDAGRFPEALAIARRIVEMAAGTQEERPARVLARALGLIVGDADAVRVPRSGVHAESVGDARVPALRRLLCAP